MDVKGAITLIFSCNLGFVEVCKCMLNVLPSVSLKHQLALNITAQLEVLFMILCHVMSLCCRYCLFGWHLQCQEEVCASRGQWT